MIFQGFYKQQTLSQNKGKNNENQWILWKTYEQRILAGKTFALMSPMKKEMMILPASPYCAFDIFTQALFVIFFAVVMVLKSV